MSVTAKPQPVIGELQPVRDLKIMDLVCEAGINVGGWAVTADGRQVKNPKMNPNYCFDWAFGGDGSPIVLCVWYDALEARGENIVFEANLRAQAKRLESITFDKRAPPSVRSRAKKQAARSRSFDERVQQGYRRLLPVRLIIVDGERATDGELGRDSSKVKSRKLDDSAWFVQRYSDDTGELLLVRGEIPSTPSIDLRYSSDSTPYVDQFSIEGPQKKEALKTSYVRSEEVRRHVLQRAAGICECCGAKGFATRSGKIFLETHHVVALSEGGPDQVWNVVAICPNDHRRAHHGIDQLELRDRLLEHLAVLHPAEVAGLRTLIATEFGG